MRFFNVRRRRQADTAALYLAIVAQARQPDLYAGWLVPDTVEGRFELVALHVWLCLRRLRKGAATATSQALLDYMFSDIDRSIREIGVGDMSMGKYMKRLGKSFYGRAAAYDHCLDAGDRAELAASMRRNILGTAEGDSVAIDAAAQRLANYVADCDRLLASQPVEAIIAGRIAFASPMPQAA